VTFARLVVALGLAALMSSPEARHVEVRPSILLLTADTQGRLFPCPTCEGATGGLARRATIVGTIRAAGGSPLLLDAGNAFFGSEDPRQDGEAILAAYAAMGYDAVNLTYRDFRFGKDLTLNLLNKSQFPVVSANLLDARTGRLLARPFVVRRLGGRRIAVMGATALPPALAHLPHIRQELQGIRIRPPIEALREWLPRVKAHADLVILLFYGSSADLELVRRRFTGALAAILVGGSTQTDLDGCGASPTVATDPLGRHVARADLLNDGKIIVTQLDVDSTVAADVTVANVIKSVVAGQSHQPQR
jgi:5'-nucleotidase / UDP-sugar diphosphatase